jgi:hypothetical protein
MLKNILKLEGAQKLTRNEQKSINGGLACRSDNGSCPAGYCSATRPNSNGIWYGMCINE